MKELLWGWHRLERNCTYKAFKDTFELNLDLIDGLRWVKNAVYNEVLQGRQRIPLRDPKGHTGRVSLDNGRRIRLADDMCEVGSLCPSERCSIFHVRTNAEGLRNALRPLRRRMVHRCNYKYHQSNSTGRRKCFNLLSRSTDDPDPPYGDRRSARQPFTQSVPWTYLLAPCGAC